MRIEDVKVDDEFRALLPELSADERKELEASIMANGFEDPLTVWKKTGILLDGHNRYEIWRTCPDLDGATPPIREKSFRDRDAAEKWMLSYQLGRRNLKSRDRSRLVKRLYDKAVDNNFRHWIAQRMDRRRLIHVHAMPV